MTVAKKEPKISPRQATIALAVRPPESRFVESLL